MGAAAPFVALSGAQAAIGLYQSYQQSKAIKQQGRYEEMIAESNARMSELQAEESLSVGSKESSKVLRKGRELQGTQRAAYAGQGVDVFAGTPGDIQAETGTLSEFDAMRVSNKAWREAWGYKTQASEYRFKGKFARMSAENQARNTLITGGLGFARDIGQGALLYKGYK